MNPAFVCACGILEHENNSENVVDQGKISLAISTSRTVLRLSDARYEASILGARSAVRTTALVLSGSSNGSLSNYTDFTTQL